MTTDDRTVPSTGNERDYLETRDWIESLRDLLQLRGPARAHALLRDLQVYAQNAGVVLPVTSQTPYINTIPRDRQAPYPGDLEMERRIRSLVRWNAMAMVVRANRQTDGIGGHISTYASAATLLEVGFNHFFRGRSHPSGGDLIYFQGHASPGVYARAFLEGSIREDQMERFRRELQPGGGLSSYPHPWLMPSFWEFPTVSMGLGPLMAIYQARTMRYLENRGLRKPTDARVWCFLGDGECDEPEALGSISLASREGLDNLIFVVNCNLQRLDGPVRGNQKIIQELEAVFRGVGWNVIKVIWGSGWDPLLARDRDGLLVARLGQVVDGEYQKYAVEGGAYIREHFFGADPRLLKLAEPISDHDIWHLGRGGHDAEKVYAAYHAAVRHQGSPTAILAKTIKGYGLGEAGEGKNITHQQKKLNEEELLRFRDRFGIPISDDKVGQAPLYRPPADSPETVYLQDRRRALGGFVPRRTTVRVPLQLPPADLYAEFLEGSASREFSTTMAFVRLLGKLLRNPRVGRHIVPIVPDEARTFGMEALFRQCGIYSSLGQVYEPVDKETLLYYKEAKDGQILEEGITEAGSLCSFIAAGTAHAFHGIHAIPCFIFYSMFGLQRVGDLIWAAADSRARGFLVGGTAGRTTLAGEGLQHQDGHSHVLALPVPNLQAYDPAYAYEVAVIVREGLRRMYEADEDIIYYLTVGNEPYRQPPMPAGAEEGILRGLYRIRDGGTPRHGPRARILGSGAILNEALRAQERLEPLGVAADVWSVTSYKNLYWDGIDADRDSVRHPERPPRIPYVSQCFSGDTDPGVFVAVSDYLKVLPQSIAPWLPGPLVSLGTDGFGRSDSRAALRDFFEVDARHIAFAALSALARQGQIPLATVEKTAKEWEIRPDKPNPRLA